MSMFSPADRDVPITLPSSRRSTSRGGHDAPVEFDFDIDRDFAQRRNFFLRIHRRISGLS